MNAASEVVLATRELFIEFAANPLQQAINASGGQREELADLLTDLMNHASGAWNEAALEAANHVLQVLQNNPTKTLQQVLARPDVQTMLHEPFSQAAQATASVTQAAWQQAYDLGLEHGSADLEPLGIDPQHVERPDSSPYLEQVLDTITANEEAAADRFAQALSEWEANAAPAYQDTLEQVNQLSQRLDAARGDMRRRAAYSAQSAANRAHAEAKEAEWQAAGEAAGVVIKKVWTTRFGPGTCARCAALHGTVRGLGEAFPSGASFGTPQATFGILNGPPRHPNCRCLILPYVEEQLGKGASSKTMKEYGKSWWAKLLARLAGGG